ncbi:hypothetical protein AXG93_2085s1000 [Marchantia polymorpha subsp. ruderalis]|uniref:Uncharacterized protein n=1 Tax=Marchantia polymorpha subsp. ruderalis TaxID=1480154 RepID=A0A176VNI5_MARPO|nr:hypothetical protein AXG93_2085s1000 [Marchantia polymorpha subsp. ruderalis]
MVRAKKLPRPKLILLKVPDRELRKYQKELIATRFDFLLWDWNCVLATRTSTSSGSRGGDQGRTIFERTSASTDEEAVRKEREEDLQTSKSSASGMQVKGLSGEVRPLEEGKATLEERSLEKVDVQEPKTREEPTKERPLSNEILEQVVEKIGVRVGEPLEIPSAQVSLGTADPEVKKKSLAEEPKEISTFPYFLQNTVVPLLKYLDGKREKYAASEEAGFYVELLRNKT